MSNILSTTANRFIEARSEAWHKHNFPCQSQPGILPCDRGRSCSLKIEKAECKHRQALIKQVKSHDS